MDADRADELTTADEGSLLHCYLRHLRMTLSDFDRRMRSTATLAGNRTTMRFFIASFCIAVCMCALAQDKSFISGTVSFEQQTISQDGSDDETGSTSIVFGPAAGIILGTNNIVGLALNVQSTSEEMSFFSIDGGPFLVEARTTTIEVAPFYRRVKSVGEQCFIYGQVLVGIGFGKETLDLPAPNDDEETNITSMRVALGPGIFYNFSNHWGVSADWGALSYSSVTEEEQDDNGFFPNEQDETTTTTFGLRLNPGALNFALNYTF